MREVDFLRQLLDYIDTKIDTKFQEIQSRELRFQETDDCDDDDDFCIHADVETNSEGNVDPTTVDSPIDDDDRFIPPLQANIEMMKKLTGVPPKDETLKQSQLQGGPSGGGNVVGSTKGLRLLGMLDNDIISR